MAVRVVKPLSHCHEFAHDMRRVSVIYNSPHISTNVHELYHKRFGQNCSTTSIRHVQRYSCRNISRLLRSCTSLYDTYTSSAICVREPHDILTTCLRVLASLYEFCTITRESLRFSTIYYDMLRYLNEISTTTYESRSTFHNITRFLYDF